MNGRKTSDLIESNSTELNEITKTKSDLPINCFSIQPPCNMRE